MLKSTRETKFNYRIVVGLFVCLAYSGLFFYSCSKNGDSVVEVKKSSEKLILTFGFAKSENPGLPQDFTGVINSNSIVISMPSNTDISALKATFTNSFKSVVKV